MQRLSRRGLGAAVLTLAAAASTITAAQAQVPPITLPPVVSPTPPVTEPDAGELGVDVPAVPDVADTTLPIPIEAPTAPDAAAVAAAVPEHLHWGDFVPAIPAALTVHQPDGTAFQAALTHAEIGGDLELDGYTLVRGDDGWWTYASGRDASGALVGSDRRAGIDAPPAGVPLAIGRHRSIWEGPGGVDTRTAMLRQLQVGFHRAAEQARAAGEPIVFRFPVLMLATWWDEEAGQTTPQFQEGNTPEAFQELLSGFGGNSTGTLTEFYFENSYGQFLVEVEVFGPFTSARSVEDRCYYGGIEPGDDGGGDLDLVDDVIGIGGAGAIGMAVEAVPQADPTVDFSRYDNDGDGFVDFTAILHSGPDMAATGDPCHTWSHAISVGLAGPIAEEAIGLPPGTLHHGIPTTDGVLVDRLFTMPEIDLEIGVATHEMAHALGEPDYYNPDYTSMGTGDWDIMAGGSWFGNPPGSNPTHFNPASRVFQGWATPTIIRADTPNLVVPPREIFPAGYTADQPHPGLFLVPVTTVAVGETDDTGHTWTEQDVYGLARDGDRYVVEGYYLENISRVVDGPSIHPEMDPGPYFDRQALSSGLMVWHFDYVRRSNVYHGSNDAGSDVNRPQMDPMEFDRNDDSQELQLGLTRGEPQDLVWDAATGITSGTRQPRQGAAAPAGATPQEGHTWTGAVAPGVADRHEVVVDDNPGNAQMTVTVEGTGDCTLQLYGPDGEPVGGTVDSNFNGPETTSVTAPEPGTWIVETGDFAACGQYDGEVVFSAAADVLDTTGAADTWSNWSQEPTGWAFTNVRPRSPGRASTTELGGSHETGGDEAIVVDVLQIGAGERDASPGFVRTDGGPVNAGAESTFTVPVFSNGGQGGPVGIEVRLGSPSGTVLASGTVQLPAYGHADFTFRRRPAREGVERYVVVVDRAGAVAEASEANNVQATDVEVGPANPVVLVVDDDGAADSEDLYAGALRTLGVPYAVVQAHADADLMRRFRAVIWEGGLERYQGQMDPEDRAEVAEYLQGGGRLLYTSPRAAAALGEGPTATSPLNTADMPAFLAEWFGVEYLDTEQVGGGTVTGTGDVLGSAVYQTDVFPGRPLQDVFTTVSEGAGGVVRPVAEWEQGGLMGVRVAGDAAHGSFRTVFLGFNLSQLTGADQAVDVLDRVLRHFEVPLGAPIAEPAAALVFHAQVRNRTAGTDTPVTAVVAGPMRGLALAYRAHGTGRWTAVPMQPGTRPGTYTATIPGSAVTPAGVEYQIVTWTWRPTTVDGPHAIGVQRG